jgi:hypothetical protein
VTIGAETLAEIVLDGKVDVLSACWITRAGRAGTNRTRPGQGRSGLAVNDSTSQGKLEFAKNSENKRFLDSLFGKVTLVTAAAITLGAAVLGGKVLAQREDSDA